MWLQDNDQRFGNKIKVTESSTGLQKELAAELNSGRVWILLLGGVPSLSTCFGPLPWLPRRLGTHQNKTKEKSLGRQDSLFGCKPSGPRNALFEGSSAKAGPTKAVRQKTPRDAASPKTTLPVWILRWGGSEHRVEKGFLEPRDHPKAYFLRNFLGSAERTREIIALKN